MRVPYRKPGKYGQMKQDPLLTEGKFNELKKELARLKKIQPQAAAEVSRLAELGDFSENAEYQIAKGRLRGINNAIQRLEYQLDHAEIISSKKQTGVVEIGNTVTVVQNKKEKTFQILGSSETDPHRGIISHNSPIGSALIGHKVGDSVIVKLAEKEVEYKIIKIE